MTGIPLTEISYPVYLIGENKPNVDDGVIFYYYAKEDGDISLHIVDDKTVPGNSLAARRLHLVCDNVKLFQLRNAIFFLGDLVKLAKPKVWFIDSMGRLFTYTKQTRAKLKYYKIKHLIPIQGGGVIVECEGMHTRYKSLYKPDPKLQYVGILHYGMSTILYGFYDQPYKETWRLVWSMPKAILSNKIYMDTTPELMKALVSKLTYKIRKNIPGANHFAQYDIIKNFKLLPGGVIAIPIGRQDLIPEGYEVIDKRVYHELPFPNPKFPLREEQLVVYDQVDDSCFINALVGWGSLSCPNIR